MLRHDHLAAVRAAARKLKRAEKAKERAQAELVAAIEAAEAAKLKPAAIIAASGLKRWAYYRLKDGRP